MFKLTQAISVFLLFLIVDSKAQDTIFTKAKEQLYVRVLEISNNEVKYKNYFNPDGVVHSIINSQIIKIIYENGKTEPRFRSTQTPSVAATIVKPPLFIIEDKHLSMNNEDIKHKMVLKLMMKRNSQLNSGDLNEALLNAEGKKNGQIALAILGPVCAVGGLYVASRNYYGPNDKPKAQAFILSGFALGITSEVVSQVYKAIKNKHIRKAALLYNDEQ